MANLRNFFITFCVCLVIFSLASAGVMQYFAQSTDSVPVVNNVPNPVTDTDIVEFGDGKEISEDILGESFTILAAIKSTDGEKLLGATLISADKDMKNYWFMSLPMNMMVPVDNVDTPIEDIPFYHNLEFAYEKIHAVTGIKADYRFIFTEAGLAEFIDAIGGIEYDVPKDMLEFSEGDSSEVVVNLKKGKQKLNGKKTIGLLKYKSYDDGSQGVCTAHRGVAKAIFSVISSEAKEEFVRGNARILLSYAETNFTPEILEENYGMISAYGSFIKTESKYPGYDSEDEDGERVFIPYIDEATSKFRQYR